MNYTRHAQRVHAAAIEQQALSKLHTRHVHVAYAVALFLCVVCCCLCARRSGRREETERMPLVLIR